MVDLGALSLEQKASLTSGGDFWHTQAVADIPAVMLTDGPHGLRKQATSADALGLGNSVPATCFPPAVALASSWDENLVDRVGAAVGAEAHAENVAVVLGPGVNIKRSPLCGRNFEYFSEDPFLTGRLGAALVHGLQSQGVGASVKHFAVNNQESDRMRVSADVDERTLREIYLPAFEHIVRTAAPRTVMCSYNKINGTYASENRWLLTELLRDEWGFEGLVVSDWGAVNDRVAALVAGLDLEMPPSGTDDEIVAAVRSGALDEQVLDRAVARVLDLVRSAPQDAPSCVADEHHALARKVAAACAVLLKNDGDLLPLDAESAETIAVIGEFARTPRFQGAGSSQVTPTRVDTALDAITAVVGAERVTFEPGFVLDGVRDAALQGAAVKAAEGSHVALLFLGLPPQDESEGFDRRDVFLPADQMLLLAAVHAVNPRTVVVLSNGGVVRTAGIELHAAALLEGWLLGQAGGSATADLLFGLTNPSGRLAETIPERLPDTPSFPYFPGGEQHSRYGEGIYVGYRYYDTVEHPVAFPFGFGLSYTEFELSDLKVSISDGNSASVSVHVANVGDRAGATVVQVYVHDVACRVDRPVHELKGFAKAELEPGETHTVQLELDPSSFAFWSVQASRWVVEAGEFEIRVGFSSREIEATARITLPGDEPIPTLNPMSTIAEWLAHPSGGPVLMEAMKAAGAAGVPPELVAMAADMPISKLVSFGFGLSQEQLDGLLEAAAARVSG
ncbi:MAG TPA: glycoside hydrolase family 3 C-terminal domain-containing protein [Aldersonia sp.]